MPATRIVIDAQPFFDAANTPDFVVGLTAELLQAKQEGAHVLFVEYRDSGRTHQSVLNLLRGYPRKRRLVKQADDGSREIARVLLDHAIPRDVLRVCGVNSDCCVLSTVNGLRGRLPQTQIQVVKSACARDPAWERPFDWRSYNGHRNVRVV